MTATIRQVLRRWATALVPATFWHEHIFVELSLCPAPKSAPHLDVQGQRAFCKCQENLCANLQGQDPNTGEIRCKNKVPEQIVAPEEAP